ncbi:hypothetical protein QBC34DRAFT_195013 [Podospora aff. communis PSN243]|uniref:Uncharacterized protein n=1 Tax=Podospora aff. communis PSN243 TaxID=3040156 RepID=A0AAV9H1B4_9PEZI|nr:hypothetical protein QBC34DRAFT_195013 [Podospora aff. communis PSN243]
MRYSWCPAGISAYTNLSWKLPANSPPRSVQKHTRYASIKPYSRHAIIMVDTCVYPNLQLRAMEAGLRGTLALLKWSQTASPEKGQSRVTGSHRKLAYRSLRQREPDLSMSSRCRGEKVEFTASCIALASTSKMMLGESKGHNIDNTQRDVPGMTPLTTWSSPPCAGGGPHPTPWHAGDKIKASPSLNDRVTSAPEDPSSSCLWVIAL